MFLISFYVTRHVTSYVMNLKKNSTHGRLHSTLSYTYVPIISSSYLISQVLLWYSAIWFRLKTSISHCWAQISCQKIPLGQTFGSKQEICGSNPEYLYCSGFLKLFRIRCLKKKVNENIVRLSESLPQYLQKYAKPANPHLGMSKPLSLRQEIFPS